MVVVEGPRFSTRAESRSYSAAGWDVVNMTGHPEAVLARELGLCYATIALVTDLDAGLTESEAVDQATVLAVFAANTDRLRGHLTSALDAVTGPTACRCRSWQDDVTLTFDLP